MTRIRLIAALLIAPLLMSLAAFPAQAQIPDSFENLQVLPGDISKQELMQIMRKFAGDLGVRCSHCHEGPDNLQGMDFATDAKATKKVARSMMKMVDAINGQHLAGLETGREQRVEVGCQTCHNGINVPRAIDGLIADRLKSDGIESASALYRELREQHFGSAAYDFSSKPLNALAERVSRGGQLEEGLALIDLNIEFHPEDGYTRILQGGILMSAGKRGEAIAAFEKALEINPENSWARRQLERARASDK